MEDKKIVIVGGGLAGLSAAYTLNKRGLSAEVYEAGSEWGGRCRTDYADGFEFFAGAFNVDAAWAGYDSYIEELGLSSLRQPISRDMGLGFYTKGKLNIAKGGGLLSTIGSTAKALMKALPFKVMRQASAFVRTIETQLRSIDFETENFGALAEMGAISVADFAREHGFEQLDLHLLDPLVAMMCAGSSEEVAMSQLILLFSQLQALETIDGGMGVLGEAMLFRLDPDRMHLNTPVRSVLIEDGRAIAIETDEGRIDADEIIVALDAPTTLELIPDLPASLAEPLAVCRYSSTFAYEFGLKRPLPKMHHAYVMIPRNAESLLNTVIGAGSEDQPILYTTTRQEFHDKLVELDPAERDRLVITAMRQIIPEFPEQPAALRSYRWDRAMNLQAPGQLAAITELKESHMTDVSGLHLAGDYLLPISSIEASLASGRAAAWSVYASLRRQGLTTSS